MKLWVWGFPLLLIGCFSCSSLKPGCIVQNQGTAIVTGAIVGALECENVEAVRTDVLKQFEKLGLCPNGIQGPVADAVCPAVSQFAVSFLAGKAIPSAWQCSATNTKAALALAVEQACKKIPF